MKTFTGKPIYQVRARRSPARKKRKSSKSPAPVDRGSSERYSRRPPSATVTSTVVVMEDSPVRSPSIMIDYPSPEKQLSAQI